MRYPTALPTPRHACGLYKKQSSEETAFKTCVDYRLQDYGSAKDCLTYIAGSRVDPGCPAVDELLYPPRPTKRISRKDIVQEHRHHRRNRQIPPPPPRLRLQFNRDT